jgi:hypothetical protein
MLKPILSVACEKVIVDQQQNGVPSLIALFDKMIVAVPKDAEIPSNALGPREWCIFSKWDPEASDVGKDVAVCTQIFYPDGTPLALPVKVMIKVEPNKKTQAIVRVQAFPLGQKGFYTVRSWIEENAKAVGQSVDFRIELEFSQQDEPVK